MTELVIPTEQVKRQHSADKAMAHRQWTIIDTTVGWLVKTQTDTYSIVPHPDGRLVCSCPDNLRYGALGIECKHIRGLLIYLEEGSAPRQHNFISTGGSTMTTEYPKECGWVKLFHPSAAQVTVPLYLDRPLSEADARTLLSSVSSLIQAGFSVEAPGLEEGEHIEEIGCVVRRSKANTDGTETPVVDLYPARGNFRLLGKYLNTEVDLREFQAASGLSLETLPLYEGDNAIERGKSSKMDKYVVALPHPVRIVWKLNQRYEGENDKKNAKRLFVRWENIVLSPLLEGMSLNDARTFVCPLGTKTHPEYKGMTLEQIAQAEDGIKVLEYLAGDQYRPNGDGNGQQAKVAAKALLASLQPA